MWQERLLQDFQLLLHHLELRGGSSRWGRLCTVIHQEYYIVLLITDCLLFSSSLLLFSSSLFCHLCFLFICSALSWSGSHLVGLKVRCKRYGLTNPNQAVCEIRLTMGRGWEVGGWEERTLDPLYGLFFVASGCSTSARLSSLVGNMKIDFAPLDLPLSRRLQTAIVLQWVFSFLGLGEFSCLLCMYLETCVNVENRWDGTVHLKTNLQIFLVWSLWIFKTLWIWRVYWIWLQEKCCHKWD